MADALRVGKRSERQKGGREPLGQDWGLGKALTGASDMSTGCRLGSDLTCLL